MITPVLVIEPKTLMLIDNASAAVSAPLNTVACTGVVAVVLPSATFNSTVVARAAVITAPVVVEYSFTFTVSAVDPFTM